MLTNNLSIPKNQKIRKKKEEKQTNYLQVYLKVKIYKFSTCFLAQGVFLKKVKLLLTLGLLLKQLMLIL
jgi:hypothetical protein